MPRHDRAADKQIVETIFKMPGHLLRRCHQISVAIYMLEYQRHDLTPLQFVTLAALVRHGPQDQATLGGIVALDRTTIAGVVRNLEQRGFATRHTSTKDRRSKIVQITDAGRSMILKAVPLFEQAQERLIEPLSADERKQLIRLLSKMAEANNELSRAPMRVRDTTSGTEEPGT